MKLFRRANDWLTAHHWANLLKAAGIAYELRNTHLSGALGEIPFLDAAPQLWLEARDVDLAEQVLADAAQPSQGAPWRCAQCGELLEPQFADCWRCGGQLTT